jgi:flagellar biosynthetic protein FlhB
MAAEQEQDRSEPATPHKLREARKRGQVAKSMEVNSFAALCAALALLYFAGEGFVEQQLELNGALLASSHHVVVDGDSSTALVSALALAMLEIYWPVLAVGVLTAIAVNMLQTGPMLSFVPLKPDLHRLSPVQGFKRLFSKRLLFEAAKTCVKFVMLGALTYFALVSLLPSLVALIDVDPSSYAQYMLEQSGQLVFQLLLVLFLVALFDLTFNRTDFAKRMRMSRRELKDEVKRREGDPLVRAKQRELQREAAKRARALQRVPDADVLITNPTHLAVALRYDGESMRAPTVTAKGGGELALKMREVAYRHGVPVVENRTLAQALFRETSIDETIPEDLYPIVARLMAWVSMLKRRRLAPTPSGARA